ncbi:MAG: hypothetical protein LBB36_04000 [Fibromonadaceae bacterium]|jgi:hypothetical protein|nr:hypothetical protein [Fibromonadaceae bacterium]
MQAQIEFNSYVKNGLIAIPKNFVSVVPDKVYVIVKPVQQKNTEKKQAAWLSGNSRIDNPAKVGKKFRKYSRDELYDRKSIH